MTVTSRTGVALGAVEFAANASGVPFAGAAATLVKEIADLAEQVQVSKGKAKNMTSTCVQLLTTLDELSAKLAGTELQASVDEIVLELETVRNRTRTYAQYSKIKSYMNAKEISRGIDKCEHNLELVINKFTLRHQILTYDQHNNMQEQARQNHEELKDILYQVLTNRADMANVVAMQSSGEQVAEIFMRDGQNELRNLRRPLSPTADESIAQRQERYQQYESGLMDLHRSTGIPPSVKVLDGEVTKVGDIPFAGGPYSDIWEGRWLHDEKVALKCLRNVKTSDPKGKKRFEREIAVWDTLKNEHILPFYGICYDLGYNIHMVSPWQEHGDVLGYVKSNPGVDKISLMLGAAKGMEYLHSQGVIHGNVKCTNIVVMASGQTCICDFGVAKVMEDVTEMSVSATLTNSGGARWLAPELMDSTMAMLSPTTQTDVYSFGMAILELLTERPPWCEVRREAMVILNVVSYKKTPSRPTICESDELWRIMEECWTMDARERPEMAKVREGLEGRLHVGSV